MRALNIFSMITVLFFMLMFLVFKPALMDGFETMLEPNNQSDKMELDATEEIEKRVVVEGDSLQVGSDTDTIEVFQKN